MMMKPTIVVIGYKSLTSFIRRIQYAPAVPVNLKLMDALFEDAFTMAKRLEDNGEADVFVSAGGNSNFLSQNLKTPFVEIKFTGYDLLSALTKARKYSNRIGVVTCSDYNLCLEKYNGLFTSSIKHATYSTHEQVVQILDEFLDEDIKTVIGTSIVLEVAKNKGMRGIFLYSSDGIVQALDTAVMIASAKKLEMEMTEEFRAIINWAYEGIIATDNKGIVTVFNQSAESITGIKRQKVLGQNLDSLIPNARIMKVIQSQEPELNKIIKIGEKKVLTNRIPIVINHETTGLVVTFQNIGIIQEAEQEIRQNLNKKGFLAKTTLADILGNSLPIRKVKETALLYAKSDSTVLIMGESGTGKELFAQAIHNASARAKLPFVAINCAALPENLLESELFGYEEGAFTGAKRGGKPGLFELAHGGTIFLDEVGEISLNVQARLLRVLEEHAVLRLGGERIIPTNVRVIAATNKNLWGMVEQHLFRDDLYYRLNVLELEIPPLRMRYSDISEFVRVFLTQMRSDLTKQTIHDISCNPVFTTYSWPGNVRELRNIIERFAVLYVGDTDASELILSLLKRQETKLDSNERDTIGLILSQVNGNKSEAAKRLGVSRTTLWRKLKEMNS